MRYSLQDVFSVTIFCLPRRLQDVLKTSSRRLGRQKIVMLKTCWRSLEGMSWRRLQDVFKTSKCLLGRWKVFWLLIFNSWFSNLIVVIHILLLINKTLWSLLMDGIQGCKATVKGQFTFYHNVPKMSCYSFDRPEKNETLSWPWSQI